ncbi:SDR family oxidoreductase [Chryseobacterium salviniae]|uniref:SDR family oxidoreductase n=1 Tax=Chryseobacterium salviniae TaxID=3101750 RepID=A0ABU6HVH3_9FLAO|nr:SDR family oxidoreductase [Chryseobacterium sp. T9W2-O]MEC3876462.1 SDR family oxidoreductase [Chryseobacterium sp. T9W2-O]
MKNFNDKFALITGGTKGMGFATAQKFIHYGGKVIITGRSEEGVKTALEQLGSNASGIVSDAATIQDIMNLRNKVEKLTGNIHLVFANAGYGKFAPIENVDERHFDELFNMLVKGSFFTVQQMLPLMRKGSSVVFNTSFVTEVGMPNFSVYSAAKSAVQSFIKTFATELSAKGIRVNGISPGHIKTNIFENTGLDPEHINEAVKNIIASIPFKRQGTPEEIADAVLFLASEEASYIHGAELRIDAGVSVIR